MKTSDVSSGRPVQQTQNQTAQTGKKGKPQREFGEVLQQTVTAPAARKIKGQPATEKAAIPAKSGTTKKPAAKSEEKKEIASQQRSTGPREERGLRVRDEREPEVRVKDKKDESKEASPGLPPNASMGPSPLQQHTAVEKITQRAPVDIKDLESIVQRVQVGVNEKGLPEFQLELKTKTLGELDLKVTTENDQIKIQLTTQDSAAQEALQENLQELSRLLQDKGLNLGEVNVMTRDQRQQQEEEQAQQQEEAGEIDAVKPKTKRPAFKSFKDALG